MTEVDADGRILRLMNFDVDDRDAASAALHEWAAEREQLGDTPLPSPNPDGSQKENP